MTDAAMLLDLVRQAVREELQPLLDALAPAPLPAHQRALLDALIGEFADAPFVSREVDAARRSPLKVHEPLRRALRGADDVQAVGQALASLAKAAAGARVRLVRCKAERGSAVWAVVGLDPA